MVGDQGRASGYSDAPTKSIHHVEVSPTAVGGSSRRLFYPLPRAARRGVVPYGVDEENGALRLELEEEICAWENAWDIVRDDRADVRVADLERVVAAGKNYAPGVISFAPQEPFRQKLLQRATMNYTRVQGQPLGRREAPRQPFANAGANGFLGFAAGSDQYSRRALRVGVFAVGSHFAASGVVIVPYVVTGLDEILEYVHQRVSRNKYLSDQVARIVCWKYGWMQHLEFLGDSPTTSYVHRYVSTDACSAVRARELLDAQRGRFAAGGVTGSRSAAAANRGGSDTVGRTPAAGVTSPPVNRAEEPQGIDCDTDSVIDLEDYPWNSTPDAAEGGVHVLHAAAPCGKLNSCPPSSSPLPQNVTPMYALLNTPPHSPVHYTGAANIAASPSLSPQAVPAARIMSPLPHNVLLAMHPLNKGGMGATLQHIHSI